jgi:hypothetical protein
MKSIPPLVLLCLTTTAALAASFSGTLSDKSGPASISWSGGPMTGALGYGGLVGLSPPCNSTICDIYNLTLDIPSTFYSSNPNFALHVTVGWSSNIQDIDVYVFDVNGNLVGASATGGTSSEDADLGQLPPGSYQIQIVPASCVATFYGGTISMVQELASPVGKVQYKLGNFTFTSQVLARPPQTINSNPATPLFLEQDAEPRVVHDPLGNIYVAAIQGVPAGTDLWKSMDGGNTFDYLGEPDGTQAAAAAGAGTGVGIGGGDEDITVGSSGKLALASLWLGSVTNCASSDSATTWLCNPFASDLPEDDRQWLAFYGQNMVYLTTKQLGTLDNSTLTIYVAKSFDGGISFPQVAEVTKPVLGVQPGDQGNMVVDQSNGNVYMVFIGAYPNQVYLAKSSDGGLNWLLKLIYQSPSGTSLQHVFPAIAIDRGGNLHVVFNDGRRSLLTSSRDQGASWTTPVQVNTGANAKTSVEPWVVAGDAGKLNIFFYGTSSSDYMDPNAQWQIFMAQTQNAFRNVPVLYIKPATGIMHKGAICVNGTACPNGTRNLLEYFFPDTYLDGNALATYPDDLHVDPSTTVTRAWFLKQIGGTRILGAQ